MRWGNLISLIALFVALSGVAYATHPDGNNTIDSGDIINGEVRTADLADDSVNGGKLHNDSTASRHVVDDSLTGNDVAFDSLSGVDVDEGSLDAEQLPPTASLASQIRNIGTGGDVLYGGGSGRTTASADMGDVQIVGGPSYDLFGFQVWVDTAPGVGESRTFRVVRRSTPGQAIFNTNIICTIGEGEQFCSNTAFAAMGQQLFAIKVESVGAGLSSADDAYVGVGVGG